MRMLVSTVREISRGQWDVVEFYGGESWLTVWILGLLRKRPFVTVAHSNGLETYSASVLESAAREGLVSARKWYQLSLDRWFEKAFTRVDAIVTVSENERRFALGRKYRDEAHIVAIENALGGQFRGRTVVTERERRIGYCGSWLERKGTRLIERDVPKFLGLFPDWTFTLVGVGEGFRKEDHFPRGVVERIEVVGYADRERELTGLYESFRMVVAPSVYESFGLVIAEAMACGCAVITRRVGFAADLRNREEVLLCDEEGGGSLFDGLIELASDEGLRRQISYGGYQRVQRLEWGNAVERLEESYRRWVKERQDNRFEAASSKG